MRLFKDYITRIVTKGKKIVSLPIVLLTNIYLAVLGISWLSIHIYFRFCISRPEYTLVSLKPYITNYHLGLAAVFIIMHFVILIIALHNLYRRYTIKQSTFKIIPYLQKIIDYLYWKPLEYIHDIIAPDLPYSGILLLYIGKLLAFNPKYSLPTLIIIFDFLPKVILSLLFFIELIIFNQIYYFVHFIGLILLPIILTITIKLMESFALRNLPLMRKILVITPKGSHKQGFFEYDIKLQENYNHLSKEQLNFYATSWRDLIHLSNYSNTLKKIKTDYSVYIIILTSSCYLVAGLFKFVYLIS